MDKYQVVSKKSGCVMGFVDASNAFVAAEELAKLVGIDPEAHGSVIEFFSKYTIALVVS